MGRLAQAIGSAIEEWAEISFRRYEAEGKLTWSRCYPATKTIYNGKFQRKQTFLLPEEGPPDYCLALAPAGRLLWLEIKTWEAVDLHTERKRLHQYRQMMEARQVGGLGAYLVAWRPPSGYGPNLVQGIDWRLHPVEALEFLDNALIFRRELGCPVASSAEGWPEWWPVLPLEGLGLCEGQSASPPLGGLRRLSQVEGPGVAGLK